MQSSKEEQELIEGYSVNDRGNYLNASNGAKLFFFINGIIFNLLTAISVLTIQFYQIAPLNKLSEKTYVGEVKPDSYALETGLKEGDLLTALDGNAITSWQDLYKYAKNSKDTLIKATFIRNASTQEKIEIQFEPASLVMQRDGLFNYFLAGFEPSSLRLQPTFLRSIKFGFTSTMGLVGNIIFFKSKPQKVPDYYSFSDPVTTTPISFGLIGSSYEAGKQSLESSYDFLVLLFCLNIIAALFNLIPYPAFDGGHIALILVEAVSGKKLGIVWKEKLAIFGLGTTVFLFALFLSFDVLSVVKMLVNFII